MVSQAMDILDKLNQMELGPIIQAQVGIYYGMIGMPDVGEINLLKAIELNLNNSQDYYHSNLALAGMQISQTGKYPKGHQLFTTLREPENELIKLTIMGLQDQHSALGGQRLSQSDNLRDKSILINFEGGLGDSFWFFRYCDLLEKEGISKIYWVCSEELKSLFEHSHHLVSTNINELTCIDYVADLLTLFARYQKSPYYPHYSQPYLFLPNTQWHNSQISLLKSNQLNVGIFWNSKTPNACEPFRSMELQDLIPLVSMRNVNFISLQVGELSSIEAEILENYGIADVGAQLNSFIDTAYVVKSLDLLISVDTAIIHLAGALGCKVWTLLCAAPDYRWFNDHSHTPWYPSMRLFRQTTLGDWRGPVNDMCQNLKEYQLSSDYGLTNFETMA
jgi:hypothetical protein